MTQLLPKLKNLLRENRLLFSLLGFFFAIGTIVLTSIEKGDVVLFFSENRTPAWNFVFRYGTLAGEHYAYLLLLIFLLFVKFRHAAAIPLLGAIVTVTAYLGKETFRVYRPRRFFTDLGVYDELTLVENVVVHSGANSFPSGHSMSGFALFTFAALCLSDKRYSPVLLALLAILVGVSRVYLVQHFWQDILAGGSIGVLLALLWYRWHLTWGSSDNHWLDRKVGGSRRERV